MKKARLYQKLNGDLVQCLACSWYCRISSEQLGICATRYNKKGDLYSLVYGKAIGLHLDPVEKKPLFHFLPGSRLLSFGTVGCNFGCLFCQNWEMSQINKTQKSNVKGQKLLENLESLINSMSEKIMPQQIVEMTLEEGAVGIAYTYNEPAIFVEFAYETAKIAKKKGLKNVFVSNGFESRESFKLMRRYLDAINIDLKSFQPEFYQKICQSKIEPVKENIRRYFQSGIETEVTTLIIPGYNDSEKELTAIAQFLVSISSDLPWHISAFYPAYKMLDVPPTSVETLNKAYDIGRKVGLKYVYVGNVYEPERSATVCPRCGALLVDRSGYQGVVKDLDIKNGCCRRCGEKIYGVWS